MSVASVKNAVQSFLQGLGNPNPVLNRKSLPFLCSNISRVLPKEAIEQLAAEDRVRRNSEVVCLLGEENLGVLKKILGADPFKKIEFETEALDIFENLAFLPEYFQPFNHILNELSSPQKWGLYLLTGFHAVATHSEGHRSMVQEAVFHLPQAAVRGGSFPNLMDVGIGNGNILAASLAQNPKAILWGVDIAGGSLNRSMSVINSLVDKVQASQTAERAQDYGRFALVRGSATDPMLIEGAKFDGISMVLTLFTLPPSQREQALRLLFEKLNPGGQLILAEPVPSVGSPANGICLLRDLLRSAFRNNEELTVLDVAMLTAMNCHNLFQLAFLTAEEQKAMAEKVGFVAKGVGVPVYYGVANLQVFEKPWSSNGFHKGSLSKTESHAVNLERLRERVTDEVRRHLTDGMTTRFALNSDEEAILKFINEQRARLGVFVNSEVDADIEDIEANYFRRGGCFILVLDPNGDIHGTVALAARGEGFAEIEKMYLSESQRRLGLGAHLVDALLRYAATLNYSGVFAESCERLQSSEMFRGAGFLPASPPKGSEIHLPEDGFWMLKRL